MSNKCNLIISEASKGFSNKVREYFQGRGYATHVVMKFEEIPDSLQTLAAPILLVELPDKAEQSKELCNLLAKTSEAFPYPLIVIGKYAQEYEELLNEKFTLSTTIGKPTSNADLFDAVKYISEVFEFPQTRQSDSTKETAKTTFLEPHQNKQSKVIAPPTVISELPEAIPVHELYAGFRSIPEMFFKKTESNKVFRSDFKGKEYTLIIRKRAISDKSYLPKDQMVLAIIEQMEEPLSKWCATRIHRIAYLSYNLISSLCADKALVEAGKSAAFLYNWSIAIEQKNLLKKDYLAARSRGVRKDVASRVKDSAMKSILDLQMPAVGEIIGRVGRFIGREEAGSDDDISLIASAIAAVDMIDRSCWQSNYFHPRSAYKVMTIAKAGGLSNFHPAILCSVIKILSEAIASNTKILLIPKKLRNDPKLLEAAKAVRDQAVHAGEKKIEISELEPGMRLSRPLLAFDGRKILSEDLILDQDLIWRIWQLSLIRALNAPVVVC